jgi:hypothetical protein
MGAAVAPAANTSGPCAVRTLDALGPNGVLRVHVDQEGAIALEGERVAELPKAFGDDSSSIDALFEHLDVCRRRYVAAKPEASYRGRWSVELPAGVPLVAALSVLESGAVAGLKDIAITVGGKTFSLDLPASAIAKKHTAALIEELDSTSEAASQSSASDEGGLPFNVERPVRLLFVRLEDERAVLLWADQLLDDPIVARTDVELRGPGYAPVAAELRRSCKNPELGCKRLLVEADPGRAFVEVLDFVDTVMKASESKQPPMVEFAVLDHGLTSAERAAERIGTPLEFGTLPQKVVERTINASSAKMQACYGLGLAKNPNLAGKIVVRFVIGPKGRVTDVMAVSAAQAAVMPELKPAKRQTSAAPTAERASAAPGPAGDAHIDDPEVVSCIVEVYRKLRFPSPEGGSVKVLYPLSFSPR